nr:MAG TPA: hypothetical protein [Caudoviricetes sp.]
MGCNNVLSLPSKCRICVLSFGSTLRRELLPVFSIILR